MSITALILLILKLLSNPTLVAAVARFLSNVLKALTEAVQESLRCPHSGGFLAPFLGISRAAFVGLAL